VIVFIGSISSGLESIYEGHLFPPKRQMRGASQQCFTMMDHFAVWSHVCAKRCRAIRMMPSALVDRVLQPGGLNEVSGIAYSYTVLRSMA
jgi:hypothetical protein